MTNRFDASNISPKNFEGFKKYFEKGKPVYAVKMNIPEGFECRNKNDVRMHGEPGDYLLLKYTDGRRRDERGILPKDIFENTYVVDTDEYDSEYMQACRRSALPAMWDDGSALTVSSTSGTGPKHTKFPGYPNEILLTHTDAAGNSTSACYVITSAPSADGEPVSMIAENTGTTAVESEPGGNEKQDTQTDETEPCSNDENKNKSQKNSKNKKTAKTKRKRK